MGLKGCSVVVWTYMSTYVTCVQTNWPISHHFNNIFSVLNTQYTDTICYFQNLCKAHKHFLSQTLNHQHNRQPRSQRWSVQNLFAQVTIYEGQNPPLIDHKGGNGQNNHWTMWSWGLLSCRTLKVSSNSIQLEIRLSKNLFLKKSAPLCLTCHPCVDINNTTICRCFLNYTHQFKSCVVLDRKWGDFSSYAIWISGFFLLLKDSTHEKRLGIPIRATNTHTYTPL